MAAARSGRKAEAARNDTKILDAAREEFLADPEEPMATVAKRAGVHETSVYRRWGEKRALLLDALHAQTQRTVPVPATGSLRGDLLAYLTNLAEFLASPAGRATTRIAVELSGEQDLGTRNFWAMRSRPIAEILGRHQTRPYVGDVALVHQMLVAPLHMRILLTGEPIDGDFLAAVIDTVIRGIPQTTC